MPYVARDDRGLICEVQERETQSACEQVPLDDPELLAYLSGPSDDGRGGAEIRAELEASDLEFVRVIEDVITVLIDKRRSEEHTSELQSLMRISYADLCLKKKTHK